MQGREQDGVLIRFRELGSWRDGADELDVVALGDGVTYCGECKYRRKPVTRAEVETLKSRGERVRASTGAKQLHLFLWTRSGLEPAAEAFVEAENIQVLSVGQVVAGWKQP